MNIAAPRVIVIDEDGDDYDLDMSADDYDDDFDERSVASARPVAPKEIYETITGQIMKPIHTAPDGYGVYIVKTKNAAGERNDISVSGNFERLWKKDEKVTIQGEWGVYKGSPSFKAVLMSPEIPKGAKGAILWLKSDAVQGVGVKTAEKLAKFHGDQLSEVLGDPIALAASGFVGPTQIKNIVEGWTSTTGNPELVVFLGRFGLGIRLVAKVVKRYGAACRRIIDTNPWKLAEDIEGIGFNTADDIAKEAGHRLDGPDRLKAGLRYTLEETTKGKGHCGLPREILVAEAVAMLKVDAALISSALDDMLEDNFSKVIQPTGSNLIYLEKLYAAEKKVSDRILGLLENGDKIDEDVAREAVEQCIKEMGVQRDDSQVEAAVMAICNPVSIITGGPGTGKSTTQKIIVAALKLMARKLLTAAPTGRAAKRLTEVSGVEAATMHRLLKFDAEAGGFLHDRTRPFEAQRLIVDEFSMVDVELAASFLDAIKPTGGITIVGDVDQLPSVGAGQVLRDLIESGGVPVTRLRTVHRQTGDSGIVVAAARVNSGLFPVEQGVPLNGFDLQLQYNDFDDEERIRKAVVTMMAETLPAMGYNPIDDVQILTPQKKGPLGTWALNADLKARLNPLTEENGVTFKAKDTTVGYSVGDRVMHLRNDYEKSVFNGEVGVIYWVGERTNESGSREKCVGVDYSGHKAFYGQGDVHDIVLSYASTVHKSQGCEFPVAIIVCSNSHKHMLTRNLLYTAVTRAKKLCICIGNRSGLDHAVATADASRRFTGLMPMLAPEETYSLRM